MKKLISLLLGFIAVNAIYSTPNDPPKPHQHNVYVGVYLNDITNFDAKEGRFIGDIYVWFKWGGDSSLVPRVQFSNAEIENIETVHKEYDHGWNSIKYRVQASFRGIFPLQDFPFDKQTLRISFSLDETLGELHPDLAGSGMNEKFSITGWNYQPFFQATVTELNHYSDFGSIEYEGEATHVRNIEFFVNISRPKLAPIFKFILPLLIIIIITISSLGYPISNIDVRVDIVVNALLAAIAFQFAIGSEIPDVPYLVFADRLFIVTYIIILLTAVINLYIFFNRKGRNAIENKFNSRPIIFVTSVGILIATFMFVNLNPTTWFAKKEKIEIAAKDSIVSEKDSLVMNVAMVKSLSAYNIQSDFYKRGLYYYGANETKIPHLVEEIPELTNDLVRFLPDGKALITWRLKKDLKWGDGSPITSSDLLFSVKIIRNDNIDSAYTIDDRTLQILYKEKKAAILEDFNIYPEKYFGEAFKAGGIDSIESIKKAGPPPMDGPFIFDTLVQGEYIKFIRNPYFAGKKPYLSTIILRATPEGLKPYDLFSQGKGDVMYYLSHKTYKAVSTIPGYKTGAERSQRFYFLHPDLHLDVFKSLKVRQALMYGIKRGELVSIFDSTYTSESVSYRGPTAVDMLETDSSVYAYDLEYARQLIKESGFAGHTINVLTYYPDETYNEYKFAAALVESIKKIGLNAKLVLIENSNDLWEQGNHGGLLVLSTTISNGTFIKFFNTPYIEEEQEHDSRNVYPLFDQECIRLCEEYRSTLFEERRIIISQALQKIYMERLPTIPMGHFGEKYIIRDNLIGWDYLAAKSLWWNVEYWYFKPKGKNQPIQEGEKEQ